MGKDDGWKRQMDPIEDLQLAWEQLSFRSLILENL